jgi:hypothetical protein
MPAVKHPNADVLLQAYKSKLCNRMFYCRHTKVSYAIGCFTAGIRIAYFSMPAVKHPIV